MTMQTHYIKKRDLLYGTKTTASILSNVAREFMASEAYADALDFFERARDEVGIKDIKKIALKNGDTFLLARLERHRASLVEDKDWLEAGKVAEQKKKPSMKQFAHLKLHPEDAKREALPGENPLEEA